MWDSHGQNLAVTVLYAPFSLDRGVGSSIGRAMASGAVFEISVFGFRVLGFGFRVSGFGFRVSGSGFRILGRGLREGQGGT